MSKLEFQRNGRKVSRDQFFDGIKDEVIGAAEKEIEKRLKSVRDPKTGRPVKVSKTRKNGRTYWDIEGSPEAVARAEKIIGGG